MSAALSTGSPNERRASGSKSFSQDENAILTHLTQESTAASSAKKNAVPLTTSKLANQSCPKLKMSRDSPSSIDMYPMDKLYAKLSDQQPSISAQSESIKSEEEETMFPRVLDHQSSSSSLPITPATETFGTAPTTRSASTAPNEGHDPEVLRLKQELAQAQANISSLKQEITQTRGLYTQESSGCVTPLDVEFPPSRGISPAPLRIPLATGAFGLPNKAPFSRDYGWVPQDDTRSDTSDQLSAGGLGRARGIWNTTNKLGFPNPTPFAQADLAMGEGPNQASWMNNRGNPGYESSFAQQPMDAYRPDRTAAAEHEIIRPVGRRGGRHEGRFQGPTNYSNGYTGYNLAPTQYDAAPGYPAAIQNTMSNGMGVGMYSPYQQQSVGTSLSPHATEFTSAAAPPWKNEVSSVRSAEFVVSDRAADHHQLQPMGAESQTFVAATEPLNYRRLLDRNVTCDWKYIVDKIVCNNDQQASIFLQQKLKVGTPEQKYDIVEAIVAQAYPLMVNRFGNFLVQRCFEHGTPEQVIKIAQAIRGNTLGLSMDPFGCHVVQKAFDSVPEDYKANMVHELLRRIPDTVIHRYACHVWQKLFELRWTESPPQIMKYVNEALCGMWHEVALGETGSLVVQNIFENCLEEDKRPCIEEVLANIDLVAHGQFGNWCIQHICEHGAPADRSRAVDHVIRYASEYSMDQFASKVVEKCLKIGGPEFLGRYLDRVCEGRVDRPRIPLIDIASDQYGNYLIQYILTHANPHHREIVAAHIRKHMVSLRGSKFGSRVGMLCTNHAVATRPGPGVGPAMNTRMAPGPRYNGAFR
ncbi:meiotic coiled-coil protein 2 [Rhypophila sp. PSN 637]